jgi:hypothetical protein
MKFESLKNESSTVSLPASVISRPSSVICRPSSVFCPRPSTPVENLLQITLFLTNKPKVKYAQMNLSSFITSKYEKVDNWLNQTTNPIQTQFLTPDVCLLASLSGVKANALSSVSCILSSIFFIEQAEVGNSWANAGIEYPDSNFGSSNRWYPADSLIADRFSLSDLLPFTVNISINGEFGNSLAVITDLLLEHYAIESFCSI